MKKDACSSLLHPIQLSGILGLKWCNSTGVMSFLYCNCLHLVLIVWVFARSHVSSKSSKVSKDDSSMQVNEANKRVFFRKDNRATVISANPQKTTYVNAQVTKPSFFYP